MNRYLLFHRLTGPAILLLLGIVALLHQAHLVRFSIFVPLLLILIGVIKLAERAALAADPVAQTGAYPGAAAPYSGTTSPAAADAAPIHDFGNDPEGGRQ